MLPNSFINSSYDSVRKSDSFIRPSFETSKSIGSPTPMSIVDSISESASSPPSILSPITKILLMASDGIGDIFTPSISISKPNL